jgi:hypothetical protein
MAHHFPGLISSHNSARRSSYLRQGDSDNRPAGHGGQKLWPSDNLISLDSAVDKREHHRLIRKHGYDPATHPSKDSVMELTEIWQKGADPVSDARKLAEYERIVALRSTTMTEVESATVNGAAARSSTPSGHWILVRHDVHQTKVPV